MDETKHHRSNNWKHTKLEKKKYFHLLKEDSFESDRLENLTNFNFKKTNAFKKRYSCGGYGGTCGMCKRGRYKNGKTQRKMTINTGGGELNLCISTKYL